MLLLLAIRIRTVILENLTVGWLLHCERCFYLRIGFLVGRGAFTFEESRTPLPLAGRAKAQSGYFRTDPQQRAFDPGAARA